MFPAEADFWVQWRLLEVCLQFNDACRHPDANFSDVCARRAGARRSLTDEHNRYQRALRVEEMRKDTSSHTFLAVVLLLWTAAVTATGVPPHHPSAAHC